MDFKKEAAKEAITLIEGKNIIGLGAGTTIAYIVEFLEQQVQQGLNAKFVTSSFSTLQLLIKKGLPVLPVAHLSAIDIYFDGCDQFDRQLNALKSGGGIHTQEKLLARMATEFVLVGDDKKLVDRFSTNYPLVVEVIPEAMSYLPVAINRIYGDPKSSYRVDDKKDGLVITANGNYLLDVWFTEWPDVSEIAGAFKKITGVVEISLFYKIASKAIIAGQHGIQLLERGKD